MRRWVETITGLGWTRDGEPTIEEATNAYLYALQIQGAENVNLQYSTPGVSLEGSVIHSIMIDYTAETRVSYTRALEDYFDGIADEEAAEGFYEPQDLTEVLRAGIEEDEDNDSELS